MAGSSSSEINPLDALAEEFVARHRLGEKPSVSEYAAKHPELANDIRNLFPGLVLMEGVRPNAGDATGPAPPPSLLQTMDRLGDYRIVREIGRGGMGVVYEAEQMSLGRHVALKLLPSHGTMQPMFLERFRREAKAAARLHHTNIVPVFGVGEDSGLHFFAMQYIQGQGLDQVLQDVRAVRHQPFNEAPVDSGTLTAFQGSVAKGLLTGQFDNSGGCEKGPDPICRNGPAGVSPKSGLAPFRTLCPEKSGAAAPPVSSDSAEPRSSTGISNGGPQGEYYRSVARIGLQAADGIAYAHRQGVLHRDVKPSNILLDLQGTVWITDFGLAKSEGAEDLSQAGEIVGTVRFMAPERFEGRSLPQSDVYGLGATLYEMLTLRPAFQDKHKARLIKRVLQEPPLPPRKVDPYIPRDLETIVLKCLAKDAPGRYATALALAEDLRRFLENRPIVARRVSAIERLRRWCRRNPAVAALTFTVFVLLACIAVGSTLTAFWLQNQRDAALAAEAQVRKEEQAKTEMLWQSYVDQAKASRFSRQVGQRFGALDAIHKAAQLAQERHMPPERLGKLRNLAIACLALPDMLTLREWNAFPGDTMSWNWDHNHRRYARIDFQGHISVRRLEDDVEIASLTFVADETTLCFSADGRFLTALGNGRLRIWDLSQPNHPVVLDEKSGYGQTFHPDGRHVVFIGPDGSILQADLTAAKQPPLLLSKCAAGASRPVFDAEGKKLGVIVQGVVHILDAKTGELLTRLPEPRPVEFFAWHPRSNFLAVVCSPHTLHVWDLARMQQLSVLEGCRSGGIHLAFTPEGELLVSTGWEAKLRFWNWRTGQQLLQCPGHSTLHFSPQGQLMISETGGRVKLVEVAVGMEYRSLARASADNSSVEHWTAGVHPNGRLLAVSMTGGACLWDLQTGHEAAFIPLRQPATLAFAGADGLVVNGGQGLLFWPTVDVSKAAALLRIGPPQFWQTGVFASIASTKDGKVLVQARFDGALVLHQDRQERPIALGPQADVRGAAISPDGRWVATASHQNGADAKLWDADTGRFIKELPPGPFVFSPDGKWLAARQAGRILTVGTWAETPTIHWTCEAFSPIGRLLAVELGQGVIVLLDPATGREQVRLEDPNQDSAFSLCFTPDGTRLIVVSDEGKAIHIWDLSLLRRRLADLGLDESVLPRPLAKAPHHGEPLQVEILGADLVDDPPKMLTLELLTYALRLATNPLDADAYVQIARIRLLLGTN